MILKTTLVVLALTARGAIAQAPSDTIAQLGAAAQYYQQLGRAHGEDIWPGFRPDTIPIAFVLPSGTALLGWTGAPPSGFQPVTGTAGAVWRGQSALGAASTAIDIGGKPVAQVVLSSLDQAELVALAAHEAFHVFEGASAKPGRRFGRGENSFYVSSYPIFDVQNESMFASEGRLLSAALAAPLRARRDLAAQFVAVRRARQRRLDGNFAEFDRASEMNEGLAEYARIRALMLIAGDPSASSAWRSSARRQLDEQRNRLSDLTGNVKQSFRLRYYSTGPAQALLLDAIAPHGWKRVLMSDNLTLQDALARASGIEDAERRALERASGSGDSVKSRETALTAITRLKALRAAQVDSLLGRPGVVLELSASKLPSRSFGLCGFDPQNHLQVSETVQLQTRWWRPCAGSALRSEFNVPSVHDAERGTVRAVIGPEGEVRITVEGKVVTLADGQSISGAKDVHLEAPRASVDAPTADISRVGRTVRIAPLP